MGPNAGGHPTGDLAAAIEAPIWEASTGFKEAFLNGSEDAFSEVVGRG